MFDDFQSEPGRKVLFFRSSGIEEATSTLESRIECANIWFLWELNFFKVFAAFASTRVVELRYARNRMGWQGKFESNDFRIIALNDFSSHFIEMFASHTPISSIWIELEKEKRIVMEEKSKALKKFPLFLLTPLLLSFSSCICLIFNTILVFILLPRLVDENWAKSNRAYEIELGDSLGN